MVDQVRSSTLSTVLDALGLVRLSIRVAYIRLLWIADGRPSPVLSARHKPALQLFDQLRFYPARSIEIFNRSSGVNGRMVNAEGRWEIPWKTCGQVSRRF